LVFEGLEKVLEFPSPRESVGILPGILPAHTLRPPRHSYHTACHVHFLWLAAKMKGQAAISAATSVAVHPRAARAQAECLRYPGARDITAFV